MAKAKAGQRSLDSYANKRGGRAQNKGRTYQTRGDFKEDRKRATAPKGDTWVRGHYRRDWGTVSSRDYHSTDTYRRYKKYTDSKGHVRNSGKRN